ncbi:MAG: OsmC family protein [Propionibacteriaceae bacterium]|jgi:uncharacterized OsmC-like protein|nr:OsmC family protein [Propionibacteriaceae bacterium]
MAKEYIEVSKRIAPPEGAGWYVERIGTYTYLGHNKRGSTVLLGPADAGLENSFSPGDLLKIALAACAGMSTNGVVEAQLGADFAQTIAIDATTHATEDRFETFAERMLVDVADLSAAEFEALKTAVEARLRNSCTISNTVEGDTSVNFAVVPAAHPTQ